MTESPTVFNPSHTKLTKLPNTLKQFVSFFVEELFDCFCHFVGLVLKGLT